MGFEKGDTVYINTSFGIGEQGSFIDTIIDTDSTIYVISTARGEIGMFPQKVFGTKNEAITAYKKEFDDKVDKYCRQIKDLRELIIFPSDHILCGCNRDRPAAEAYRIRAEELTGVKVLL